jgi:hypothetical protein
MAAPHRIPGAHGVFAYRSEIPGKESGYMQRSPTFLNTEAGSIRKSLFARQVCSGLDVDTSRTATVA